MRKLILGAFLGLSTIGVSMAQNAIDAYNVSQNYLRGTARFMSMAGAFGALGGDLSTLTQNPAGIGVYRSSEIGATLDLDLQSTSISGGFNTSNTKLYCNNFGYVGALNLQGSVLKTFNWGASFTRKASFDRNYIGGFQGMPTSLTNYIAGQVSGLGVTPGDLSEFGETNPYDQQGTYYPYWLGVLAYNSGLINPSRPNGTNYLGLAANSDVTGFFNVSERGYIDEYSVNFGGNIMDLVYWGIGFGITDLKYSQWTTYGEDVTNANVPTSDSRTAAIPSSYYQSGGYASYDLNNYKKINGSGFNIKLGVIIKPIEELRIGLAVHTPTWYSLNQTSDASVDFDYSSGYTGFYNQGYDELDYPSYLEYNLRSPWRFMVSAAGVIGGRFILSADFERDAFESMSYSGTGRYHTDYSWQNEDIKNYFQASNTLRAGIEYRLTPRFSVRAGYSYTGDNVKNDVYNPEWQAYEGIYTSGAYDEDTNPAFIFNKKIQYITAGLGYRFNSFYIDATYSYRRQDSCYQPFTSWFDDYNNLMATPTANIKQSDNNIVLSIGYRF